jgi:hypothetical protein
MMTSDGENENSNGSNANDENNNTENTVATSNSSRSKTRTRKVISKQQKKSLFDFYDSRSWPENWPLKRIGGDKEADRVFAQLGITHTQAAQQLIRFKFYIRWKFYKYKDKGLVLPLDELDIEEVVSRHIKIDLNQFVFDTLDDMVQGRGDPSVTSYVQFHAHDSLLITSMRERCILVGQLVFVVFEYARIMVGLFPKTAAMGKDTQMDFQKARIEQASKEWFESFYMVFLVHLPTLSTDTKQAFKKMELVKTFFLALELALHHRWALHNHDSIRPPMELSPESGIVSTYSLPVVSHTSGWIVRELLISKKIKDEGSKLHFILFGRAHSILETAAVSANLPIKIVKLRGGKVYPSEQLYEFIGLMEAIYIDIVH